MFSPYISVVSSKRRLRRQGRNIFLEREAIMKTFFQNKSGRTDKEHKDKKHTHKRRITNKQGFIKMDKNWQAMMVKNILD